jgi:putative intracellular protease/amidase
MHMNQERTVSLKDPNVVNSKARKRVAIVLCNPAVSPITGWPVGFWWSELTHPYFVFTEKGYGVEIFSYFGGAVQADGLSDPADTSGYSAGDLITTGFMHTPKLMALLLDTAPASAIDTARFDALVVAGGQGPMITLEGATALHQKFVDFYLAGKVTAALCHGSAVLRYVRLPGGEPLVKGKTVTGFANVEEDFADNAVWTYGLLSRDKHIQPWRVEDELNKLGANYVQAGLWRGFAVRDGNLVTGQQNFSGEETARVVVEALGG